jgi:hypothetical protein
VDGKFIYLLVLLDKLFGGIRMEKSIIAALSACMSDVNLMSCDRLDALSGGHGMLNLAAMAIANVIIEEVKNKKDIRLHFANSKKIELDDIVTKAIAAAKTAGADGGNAALLTSTLLYFSGSGAQVGVPVGNRKIGSMARMAAGVSRCGLVAVPTPKFGNKCTGFPAVQAIHQAMLEGRLTDIDGNNLPLGVGALFLGHASLGEDFAMPQICENAARLGTEAMLKAMAGMAMRPDPLIAAIFGAAATLELVHPDCWIPGPGGTSSNSAMHTGQAAANAAGLPQKLRLCLTDEEFDTATLIGDFGLILKDVGGPTIPGMLAFKDLWGAFHEPISAYRPTTPPLGHIAGEILMVLRALLMWNFDEKRVGDKLVQVINEKRLDPEMALIALNTISRKAEYVFPGPLTRFLVKTTEPFLTWGLFNRAVTTCEGLKKGQSLSDIIRELENNRQKKVENKASSMISKAFGKNVKIEVLKLQPLGRKKEKWGQFWVLDMDVDVKVTIDGETTVIEGIAHKAVPKATMEVKSNEKLRHLLSAACLPLMEFTLAGHTTINGIIPAAVAAATGVINPTDAGRIAEESAFITSGVPGLRAVAKKAAERALNIINLKS